MSAPGTSSRLVRNPCLSATAAEAIKSAPDRVPRRIKIEPVAPPDTGVFSSMSFNLNLRFLGVFQPDAQIGQRFCRLSARACLTGLNLVPQDRDHLSDGSQFPRNGSALLLERAAVFIRSDQNHAIAASSC